MAKSKTTKKTPAKSKTKKPDQTRLWLMYPPKLIREPLIWQLGQKFNLVTNIRQATVTDDLGIVSLELNGAHKDITAAIKWLEKKGVKVEPVEISVIES